MLAVHMGIALSCRGLLSIDKEGVLSVSTTGDTSRNTVTGCLSMQYVDDKATVPLSVPSVSVGRLITLYAQQLQSTDPKVCLLLHRW